MEATSLLLWELPQSPEADQVFGDYYQPYPTASLQFTRLLDNRLKFLGTARADYLVIAGNWRMLSQQINDPHGFTS
ncbi:MAG TPA: hypothetical protein PLF22_03055 [Pseudomonadales bacterium]|nr:hypothetical protein [Pseudomonadales bacterium]